MLTEDKLQQLGKISLIISVIILILASLIDLTSKSTIADAFRFISTYLPLIVGVILIGFWATQNFSDHKTKRNVLFLGLANLIGFHLLTFIIIIVIVVLLGGPRIAP